MKIVLQIMELKVYFHLSLVQTDNIYISSHVYDAKVMSSYYNIWNL